MSMPPIPPDVMRAVIDKIAATRPDLWAKCYPKIYNSLPAGYESPRELACTLVGTAAKVEQGYLGDNEKAEAVWASKLVGLRVPLYVVTRDMAEALKLTTPPQVISLEDIHLPFEAAVFLLPPGVLVNEDPAEGDATYLSYVRTRMGEQIRSHAVGLPEFWWPRGNGTMTVFAGTQGKHLLHWTIPNIEKIDLGHMDAMIQTYGQEQYRHLSEAPGLWLASEMLSHEDNRFMARVVHLLFGLLLLMTSRPDLVEQGKLERRLQKKGERPREFWSPAIIGPHYKLRHVPVEHGGTHASPRFHWVRGFYREQPYGEGRSLRKQIWVEPYARGGE